jgi:hypothetical protein
MKVVEKKLRKKTQYNLPGGSFTTSAKKCQEAWSDLARPMCDLTGAKLHAFDPSVQLQWKGSIIDFPISFLMEFNKSLENKLEPIPYN